MGVSSTREGWNYQGIVARLQSGVERTFSNWTRVIIRRRTFSNILVENGRILTRERSYEAVVELLWTIVTWGKKSWRIVKGLKFTCNLHPRSWIAWIDLVQEIGQLGRVLEWTWEDLWIGIERVFDWYIYIFFFKGLELFFYWWKDMVIY